MSEKIVLGLGDNIDYEMVWDPAVLNRLAAGYDIRPEELCTEHEIDSERALLVALLGFLRQGAGGERFVNRSEIIRNFAGHFRYEVTLGGTSVRAAIAMRVLGNTSALHLVTDNPHVRRLLPPDCPRVCSSPKDTEYPHLIVQFSKGDRVTVAGEELVAARSNRIIFTNDEDNCQMALNEAFADFFPGAEVVLVSGFNAMRDEALLAKRLATLKTMLQKLPKTTRLFYEDACFHRPALSGLVRKELAGYVDIHSMNEDEMQAYTGRKIDLLNPGEVLAALEELHGMLAAPVLAVHTRWWALASGENAAACEKALKGGITMATTRFLFGDGFTPAQYRMVEQSPEEAEGRRFANELHALAKGRVCCLPSVEANTPKPTTIGLGDAFVGGFLRALAGGE